MPLVDTTCKDELSDGAIPGPTSVAPKAFGAVGEVPKVIESSAPATELGTGFAFRSWNYAIASIKLAPEGRVDEICLDTGCGVSLVDRAWLFKNLPDCKFSKTRFIVKHL